MDKFDKLKLVLDNIKVPTLSLPNSEASVQNQLQSAVVAAGDSVKTKKNQRINHCLGVTDAICAASTSNLNLLGNLSETLFSLCDDPDSDIRLVASDCLNRLVRSLRDRQLHEFQVEVYKEIKRNRSPKSLRAALNLFSFMSPLIRPQKCRPFAQNIVLCFADIAKRDEDLLYDSLAASSAKIFEHLGPFLNDEEVKRLCDAFLENLSAESIAKRRASASILVSICQLSPNRDVYLPRLLQQVTDLLMPNVMENSSIVIIGGLLFIRQALLPIYEHLKQNYQVRYISLEQQFLLSNIIKIYEMCMILCNHDDHNVVTTTLETLQLMLTSPPLQIIIKLDSPLGLSTSYDVERVTAGTAFREGKRMDVYENIAKLCQTPGSTTSSDVDNSLLSSSTITLEGDTDVPTFKPLHNLSTSTEEVPEDFDIDESIGDSERNSDIFCMANASEPEGENEDAEAVKTDDEGLGAPDKDSSKINLVEDLPELNIGSLFQRNRPLFYCSRFLIYNFLLPGRKGRVRNDSESRISVKVLAMNCINQMVLIRPDVFHLPLAVDFSDDWDPSEEQFIYDLCLFSTHSDPMLRCCAYTLIGNAVKAILLDNNFSFEENKEQMLSLLQTLNEGLNDSSNLVIRRVIASISSCLNELWRSSELTHCAEDLFLQLLDNFRSSYWLIKVEFVTALSSINCDIPSDPNKVRHTVMNKLLEMLGDEDMRVRKATVSSLVRFVESCGHGSSRISSIHHVLCANCVQQSVEQGNVSCSVHEQRNNTMKLWLQLLLNKLVCLLNELKDKQALNGYFAALLALSQRFTPMMYKDAWRCGNGSTPVLLGICLDYAKTCCTTDLFLHSDAIILASELFNASTEPDCCERNSIFVNCSGQLSTYGLELMHHSLSIIKLYYTAMRNPNETQLKKVASPIVPPGKKLIPIKTDGDKRLIKGETKFEFKFGITHGGMPAHFEKLSQIIQQNWKLFKSNLDSSVEKKFTSLLQAAWKALGNVCFYLNPPYEDLGLLIHDVAGIAKAIFHVTPIETFESLRKILMSMSANEEDQLHKYHADQVIEGALETFMKYWQNFESRLPNHSHAHKFESEKIMTDAINQLQPVVVAALKMYTTNNNAMIQAEVLLMMAEIVKNRIAYGHVDPEEVFVQFLGKQVGFLSTTQLKNADVIVNNLFQFLILLCGTQTRAIDDSWRYRLEIDVVINYCKVLYQSGRPVETHCIPSLRRVLTYLCEPQSDSQNSYPEKMRSEILPILLNLIPCLEGLPLILKYIQGIKNCDDVPSIQDCKQIISKLMTSVVESKLAPRDRVQHECLLAIFSCCPKKSLPHVTQILRYLNKSLQVDNANFGEFQLMIMAIVYNCVLLIRAYDNETSEFPLMIVTKLWERMLEDLDNSFPYLDSTQSEFTASLMMEFIQVTTKLYEIDQNIMRNDRPPHAVRKEKEYNHWLNNWLEDFIKFIPPIMRLTTVYPVLRKELIQFLFAMECSDPKQMNKCFSPTGRRRDLEMDFLLPVTISIMKNLKTPNEHEYFVHYLLNYKTDIVMRLAVTRVGTNFIKKLNKVECGILWEKLCGPRASIKPTSDDYPRDFTNMLNALKSLPFGVPKEVFMLCLELLENSVLPFICLKLSHFMCTLLNQLIEENDWKFGEHELVKIKNFISNSQYSLRFPRLISLAKLVVANNENQRTWPVLQPSEIQKFVEKPIHFWCLDEVRSSCEGQALAKMLASLQHQTILDSLQSDQFNHSVVPYGFRHARDLILQGIMPTSDLWQLMSDKRCELRLKWPLSAAVFDHVLSVVAKLESRVPDYVVGSKVGENQFYDSAIEDLWQHSTMNILSLFESLGEMFRLKLIRPNPVPTPGTEDNSAHSSFISPRLFAYFLFYVRATLVKSSFLRVNDLNTFVSFVGDALEDTDFVRVFNEKENLEILINCVIFIDVILRKIMVTFNDNSFFRKSAQPDKADHRAFIFQAFSQLSEFVASVDQGELCVDSQLRCSLVRAVRGFARCDLFNSRVLMHHFEPRPNSMPAEENFPGAPQVPIEILQNDKEGLVVYARMMKMYGIGSRMQFEENWMNLLWTINSYEDANGYQEQVVVLGIRALMMLLEQTVSVTYATDHSKGKLGQRLDQIDLVLASLEPEICQKYQISEPTSQIPKVFHNKFNIDLKSCVHSFIELFKLWLEVNEKPPPLIIFTEVIDTIVRLSEYFDDVQDYQWMFNLFVKIHKEVEKEDECIWCHLIQGIFISGAKLVIPDAEVTGGIGVIMEDALSNQYLALSNTALKSALVYLQSNPNSTVILNLVTPHLLKNLEPPSEGTYHSESRLYCTWELLLFIWIYGPQGNAEYEKLDKDLIGHIFTVLSPLNKYYASVRILVLRNLRIAVQRGILKSEAKVKVGRLMVDVMKSSNSAIFFESLKCFVTIFYTDFNDSYGVADPEPEALMQMKERCELLFQALKSGKRFNALAVSKVLPLIVRDFLPPFEILNRIISEFLLPQQKSPELVAPTITQIFEKARGRQEEMSMVREWINSSLPNFMSNADIPRTIWNLTFFLVGISMKSEIHNLLPFAELKRDESDTRKLFVHVVIDYYASLNQDEKEAFMELLRGPHKNGDSPYTFLIDLMRELNLTPA